MRCSIAARTLGAGALALMLMAAPTLAQQPSSAPTAASPAPSAAALQMARELVQANGEAHAFDGVITNLLDGAALGFLQTNPDLAPQLREVAQALRPEFEPHQKDIIDILATAYASRFSEAELKDALAFFKSAVGQKLVTDRPAIVQQAVQAMQVWGARMNAEAMDRIRAEMKKRGYSL